MEEGFTRREKLVGFFLILMVILTTATLLVIAQGKGWLLTYRTYFINLDQGYNLQQGSLVKMFNTDIGKVTKMRIKREYGQPVVEVTIRVLDDYSDFILEKSEARVVTPFPFGSEYIEIDSGLSNYPPMKEYGTIAVKQREKALTDSMAELVNEENLQRVQEILANLADLSESLKDQKEGLYATVKNVNKIALALLKSEGTLGDLLMSRDFAQRLTKTMYNLDQVLKDVNKFATGLEPTSKNLELLTANLNREVVKLGTILADIKEGSPEFPKLMQSATEFSEEGTEIMETIQENPLVRLGQPKEKKGQALHVEPRHVK
jgi:phospholipid/cholesterol/gamma-HCH transport system substrate-binding protein